MRIMLLANQPELTTRLKHFQATLEELGYQVQVPGFGTRNWMKIGLAVRSILKAEKPDVVHLFNVPDIIYHGLPELRGTGFQKLIYDYRSPWGVETQMRFGSAARRFCEGYERELARGADLITTVNVPLKEKVSCFAPRKEVHVIPNYPSRSFVEAAGSSEGLQGLADDAVIFVGRVCEQEGIANLLRVARENPNQEFWIVGGGPFARWYLRRELDNVRNLGWQPHSRVADFLRKAKVCIIPRDRNVLTPYSTDRSIWKLNEYLNMEKLVVASGITMEEERKNLVVVESPDLGRAIRECKGREPERLAPGDFRFWDGNREAIRRVYEGLI
ncbi:MAG: glycosyltransferase family 4 protein [Methanosarcinales archaeon]|nr:glycosyltransferase family 4 protein [Methanosarcinales archaeon]